MNDQRNAGEVWWVVSDLDGTLLDHTYRWDAAASTIRWLQQRGIPVIPCTSKTAEEVERFRRAAGLSDPFIVENGGAIHGQNAAGEPWEQALGANHTTLRPQLAELEAQLGEPLRALEDLTEEEGQRLLGLGGADLGRAQRRRWSVPFVPPSALGRQRLPALAASMGLQVVQGNRMGHLLGGNVSKGRALTVLKQRLNAPQARVLALGDSPNDLPLLEVADVAVVVPGQEGPHPGFREALEAQRFLLAPQPHAAGWAAAVRSVLDGKLGP